MKFSGKVIKYGDNVDTDVIIPARYLNTSVKEELAAHCMEDLDPDFSKKVEPGDIIVAGSNFGCGSSREHAPVAIKASGIFFCKDLLQKQHQHRSCDPRMSGSVRRHFRRR